MKQLIVLVLFLFPIGMLPAFSQELYPLSEPASNIPRNVLGVRLFSESYKEIHQWRNLTGLRLMYGATPYVSVYLTTFASNHHGEKLPGGFPFHNSPERGATYPYAFNGVHLYAKYRFLTMDKKNEHLRLAAYAEGSYVDVTHHEAEPNVGMGDNTGFGFGLITTYLVRKFAASLTVGGTFPTGYTGMAEDEIKGLPDIPMFVKYGPSLDYRLSLGYLLYPKVYQSFDQTNFNIYLELTGKKYDATVVRVFDGTEREYWLDNFNYPVGLQKGYYLDVSPGVQAIFKSNTRVDFSVTFPIIGMSYARLYPVYTIGIQHYFFL